MERTKANLSWIFKSRIPTQILWIWNFSDSVFLDVIYPPHPLLPFLLPFFFFFLFLLFTIRCIWNFPPLKFKIDRLISPVLTPRYFRFLLLIPRRGKRMIYYLISWKDIIKNLIPLTPWPNLDRLSSRISSEWKLPLEPSQTSPRREKEDNAQKPERFELPIKPSRTFANLLKPFQTSPREEKEERKEGRRGSRTTIDSNNYQSNLLKPFQTSSKKERERKTERDKETDREKSTYIASMHRGLVTRL